MRPGPGVVPWANVGRVRTRSRLTLNTEPFTGSQVVDVARQAHVAHSLVGVLLEYGDLVGAGPPRNASRYERAELLHAVPGERPARHGVEQIALLILHGLVTQRGHYHVGPA